MPHLKSRRFKQLALYQDIWMTYSTRAVSGCDLFWISRNVLICVVLVAQRSWRGGDRWLTSVWGRCFGSCGRWSACTRCSTPWRRSPPRARSSPRSKVQGQRTTHRHHRAAQRNAHNKPDLSFVQLCSIPLWKCPIQELLSKDCKGNL